MLQKWHKIRKNPPHPQNPRPVAADSLGLGQRIPNTDLVGH